jgi:1-acyl-sn-glycerol-3-phosphate acyltransferase
MQGYRCSVAYWVFKALLSPVLFVLWRVRVEGREHVPSRGPAVLAANHQSFCDSFFLPLVLRRRVTYVAKAEYFDHWRTAWFFRASGQIPMNRQGGSASQRALDTARTVLDSGGLLAIYPEGTRAPDTRLHRGHTGVARLGLGCDVPVIPIGILGTREIQPPGSRLMRPFRTVTVRFGPPLEFTRRRAASRTPTPNASPTGDPDGDDPVLLRELTDSLMTEIARLSEQDYVDDYANKDRKKPRRDPAPGATSPDR